MKRVSVVLLIVLLLCGCSQPAPKEESIPSNRTTITIASLHDTDIEQIVYEYNESQNEIYLKLVTYYDESGNAIDADIERMYAEFATGKTPDLYYMASIDEQKLLNASLLADWNPILKSDPEFDITQYQAHIWELFERGDQLYTLPVSVALYGLSAPRAALEGQMGWTLAEFDQFLKDHNLCIRQEVFVNTALWYGVFQDYIDFETKTCDFESEAFLAWLDYAYQCPVVPVNGYTELRSGYMQSVAAYLMDCKMSGTTLNVTGVPCATASGPAVVGGTSFALSATTQKQDACWQFVKYMLSREAQKKFFTVNSFSLPIRTDVWEETLLRGTLPGDNPDSLFYGQHERAMVDGKMDVIPRQGITEEDAAYLRQLVANAGRKAFDHDDITQIIEEELQPFLAGDRTAADCAHIIQTRMSVLLSEMK